MTPEMPMFSKFRTDFNSIIDFSGFSVTSGWNTLYDYGKRIAGLAAFIVIASALFPLWSPSQTAMQYQLDVHTAQLADLRNVPIDIALLKAQMAAQKDMLDTLNNRAVMVIIGLVAWMGKEIFEYMGGKIGRRS